MRGHWLLGSHWLMSGHWFVGGHWLRGGHWLTRGRWLMGRCWLLYGHRLKRGHWLLDGYWLMGGHWLMGSHWLMSGHWLVNFSSIWILLQQLILCIYLYFNFLQIREMHLYKNGDFTHYGQPVIDGDNIKTCWFQVMEQSGYSQRRENISLYNRCVLSLWIFSIL